MVELRHCILFKDLPATDLERLSQAAEVLVYGPNETIFKEGDPGKGIYLIREGQVQVSAIINEKDRRVLSKVSEGDFFGEMAVVDHKPRSASVITESPTEVFFIDRDCLLEIMDQSPRLAINLMRLFSLRMREFNRQYIQEVLQAERLALVGRFARSIIHDIKNPLNIIGLAAELVGVENATLEMRLKAKSRIQKQVTRLSNMVNELLEFTRGEQRETILQSVPFSTFIHQLIEDAQEDLQTRNVKLGMENEPPDDGILMDPNRLSHLFHNLWNNAADAMEPDGGAIQIRSWKESGKMIVEVEDSGPGIPPEIAGQLFEAFTTFGKQKGTGLGLSICRKIMNDHKGHIDAVSESGRGAVFRMWLPLKNQTQSS